MKNRKVNGFEAREQLGNLYWDDPRWQEVDRLRKENKHSQANSLVFEIRLSWGVE
jgi:hypothetical protein